MARSAFVGSSPTSLVRNVIRRSNCPAVARGSFIAGQHVSTARFAVASNRRAPARIFASQQTQQETPWNAVPIVENSVQCDGHHYIVVKVGVTDAKGSLCDAYRMPGMYVQIQHADAPKPGFFAISCAPNIQGYFEFIVKKTEATTWLTDLPVGAMVDLSPVQGKGYPMSKLDLLSYPATPEEQQPKDVILMATGSGIAPIRAAIESMLNGINVKSRRSVKLYYGAQYPEKMPYKDRFPLWTEDGVEVIPVMSRPGEAAQEWTGRTGYIQEALKADGIANPAQTVVLLCGVQGMVNDTKEYCKEQGVPENRLLLNF